MRIAITDSWPNRIHTAEREFIRRFEFASANVGHEAIEVVTSDDIHACQPDFVLCMHEFTPKLTKFPTLGVMWSPPVFYQNDPYRVRSIRSYDAYLVGSEHVRQYLADLEFGSNISKPKSDFYFLPMAPRRPSPPARSEKRSLAYIGVHWDGQRHGDVLAAIAGSGLLTVYGPKASWSHLRAGYAGEIAFSGEKVFEVLGAHGIALCLHKQEHREADTPSMRLFEAVAAGCVIIADEIPYARRLLGDSALYVDLRQPTAAVIDSIRRHVEWIAGNPAKADDLALRAHTLLNEQINLETLVTKTCEFATSVGAFEAAKKEEVKKFFQSPNQSAPGHAGGDVDAGEEMIDVIVRCGSRDLKYVERVIASLDSQNFGRYRILLLDYKNRSDIKQLETRPNLRTKIEHVPTVDNGMRSTALWAGFSKVTAPFFAVMDDDDEVMPDHYLNLLYASIKNPDAGFIYCGVLRIEEDGGYITAPNFTGPGGKTIRETRELKFLDGFNLGRLLLGNNYIQSNAWIARRTLLVGPVLEDPHMQFAEDMYLYLLLASKTRFASCNRASALWYWRSNAQDNSMFAGQTEAWKECTRRIALRLQETTFPRTATFMELLSTQQKLLDIGYALNVGSRESPESSTSKKRVGPFRAWLSSIPQYNAYREARRRRRHLRRIIREQKP